MTFRVGMKVVCVDDSERVSWRYPGIFERFRHFIRLGHNLNKGDVYTITAVGSAVCHTTNQRFEMLFLDGAWHFECRAVGFPSFQFRPIVERKTDITIFTAMLTPQRIDA